MLSVPYALHSKTSGTKIGFRANIIPVTVGVGSATPLQLGAIEYNDGNGADSSGFTAPEAGVYQFNVSIFWNPFSASSRGIGPNTRPAFGSCLPFSRITTALSSKRI